MSTTPLVSICCITYNHEAYIREALDSFLAQSFSGPLEIIVHDDASTDGTAAIIRAYAERHPHLFRPILQQENQYAKDAFSVLRHVYGEARGEFIALCEGDDTWTDPDKLRLQVEHLQRHPEQPLCFTNGWNVYPDGRKDDYVRAWLGGHVPDGTVDLKGIASRNFVPTAGVVFRRAVQQGFSEEVKRLTSYDWLLLVAMATRGPLGYLDRLACVRRVHAGGTISMKPYLDKIGTNLWLLDEVDHISGDQCLEATNARRAELCRIAMDHAVGTGNPRAGAPFLRRLWRSSALRRLTGPRALMRYFVLVALPGLSRLIHRARTVR